MKYCHSEATVQLKVTDDIAVSNYKILYNYYHYCYYVIYYFVFNNNIITTNSISTYTIREMDTLKIQSQNISLLFNIFKKFQLKKTKYYKFKFLLLLQNFSTLCKTLIFKNNYLLYYYLFY